MKEQKYEDVITEFEHSAVRRGKAEESIEKLKQKGGNLPTTA
jgi:hypothetical protein